MNVGGGVWSLMQTTLHIVVFCRLIVVSSFCEGDFLQKIAIEEFPILSALNV